MGNEFNLSEINRNFKKGYDTYGQLKVEDIKQKESEGFDLWQVADENNCHIKFEYRPRIIKGA